MALSSQDLKEIRDAAKQKQKIMRKRDVCKSQYYTEERKWRVAKSNNVVRIAAHSDRRLQVSLQTQNPGRTRKSNIDHYWIEWGKDTRWDPAFIGFVRPVQIRGGVRKRGLQLVECFDQTPCFLLDYDSYPYTGFDDSGVDQYDLNLGLALSLSLSTSQTDEQDVDEDTELGADEDADLGSDLDLVSWLGDGETDSASLAAEIDRDWVDLHEEDITQDEHPNGLACERPTYAQMTKLETA